MSLYNLDRFRFERKGKNAELQGPASPPAAPVRAASSAAGGAAAAAAAAAGEEEEATDDSSRPDTPASDVTEVAGGSGVPRVM
uniref:Uncharacterized protein n=1 Tax=Calidris pygmaea TaxID=425635 RepID=A0A8C3JF05_9CHAR